MTGKSHPRLRENVGGFYDACLPAGCLTHFLGEELEVFCKTATSVSKNC